MATPRMLFVNLSVKELDKTKAFWTKLGFEFNPQFTDDNAGCMVINDQCSVMLLTEKFFKGFTRKQICDTSTSSEGLFALSCTSRDEVDALVQKAVDAGGQHAVDKQDHGWMYGWSFYDIDGHHWEVVFMDMSKMPG